MRSHLSTRSIVLLGAIFFFVRSAAASPDCVVLLHGLARTSRSMTKLATELESAGYVVANVDYPSREQPIADLAPLAVERGLRACRTSQPRRIDFVTHSLGGILVRKYLSNATIPELGRVVMLGPPNQGSEVVDRFSSMPGYAFVNGPAGFELGTGPGSVSSRLGPVTYPVGVIAGTSSINPILSTALPGPNDGKVSVARARVEGMTDFRTLPASHPFLVRDSEAIRQTLAFLKNGAFDRAGDSIDDEQTSK